jgi:hypothetical protein
MTTVFPGSVQALIGMNRYMHQRISRVLLQLQKSMMFMPLREHNSLFWRQFKKDAEKAAPRPLLEELLLFVDAGLNHDTHPHELKDDERLTTDGLDLLDEIAGESWDEGRLGDGEDIPWIQNTSDERGRLEEFEKDIEEIAELPLWEPLPDPDPMEEDSFEIFTQIPYGPTIPSTKGMTGDEVRQATGNRRMAKTDGSAGTPHLWDLRSVTRYLRAMESVGRIQ